MANNRLFISYRHEDTWAEMAAKFGIKLRNYGPAWGLDTFIDSTDIDPGDTWRESLAAAVAGCTHFLCLLCDSYWESPECRKELDAALTRREKGDKVRMLFVLAEPMKPQYLSLNLDGTRKGDVSTVGDFNFLGPFNDAQGWIPLLEIPKTAWSTAIEKMLARLQKTLAA